MSESGHGLLGSLISTLNKFSIDTTLVHGRDISNLLPQAVSYSSSSHAYIPVNVMQILTTLKQNQRQKDKHGELSV